jgi:hypothetical protein
MAHVSVTDRNVGTVTNEMGEFVLKLPKAPERVAFSCLGYKTQYLSAAAMNGVRVEVRMEPSTVMLSEIVVQGADAKDLVLKAMEKISDNYPNVPNLLRGFYRETVEKRGHFTSISEGVVDVYKSAYDKNDWRDGVEILKGRRLLSQRPSDTLSVKLQGGPVLPLMVDVAKNRDYVLSREHLGDYIYRMEIPVKINDRLQYVVSMKPKYVTSFPLMYGKLFIDQETLTFTRAELQLDVRDWRKASDYMLVKKPLGLHFRPKELTVTVVYETDALGKTRMSYVRNEMRFNCDWKRRLFASPFTTVSEMVVTDRLSKGDEVKRPRGRNSFGLRDRFYDKVEYFDDPDFWEGYNIIEPTESLENAIGKLKKKVRKQ